MSEHRYPPGALTSDYARAGVGLFVCGGLLVSVAFGGTPTLIVIILAGFTVMFGYFGWRTLVRQSTTVTLSEEGLSTTGLRRINLAWKEVQNVKLSYFSTKRDKTDGWMQLSLKGGGTRLLLDSHIDGFDTIAEHAFKAALTNGITLNPASLSNFSALGIVGDRTAWGHPSEWQGDSGRGERR
ncbi:MAG: hypothetical protein ACE5Q3_06255 [Alphaproteobacteria bacterium]